VSLGVTVQLCGADGPVKGFGQVMVNDPELGYEEIDARSEHKKGG
jgi:hypothetical protein